MRIRRPGIPKGGGTHIDERVGLRHAAREAQVVERGDRLEVDVLRQALEVFVAELKLVAVTQLSAARKDLGRLEEAFEERVIDEWQGLAVVCATTSEGQYLLPMLAWMLART
jgi:hypothetical protein